MFLCRHCLKYPKDFDTVAQSMGQCEYCKRTRPCINVQGSLHTGLGDGFVGETEETEAQIRQRITEAGCDPDDPDSHDWQQKDESQHPDLTTVWYKCSRCGTEDSE